MASRVIKRFNQRGFKKKDAEIRFAVILPDMIKVKELRLLLKRLLSSNESIFYRVAQK